MMERSVSTVQSPDRIRRKRLAILKILQEATAPMCSHRVAGVLAAQGGDMSERTVRHYLMGLDREGLTRNHGRKGRTITEVGEGELKSSMAIEKVGLLSAKIDRMTYGMDFDVGRLAGRVVVNISLLEAADLGRALPFIRKVFESGYSMGRRLALWGPGERCGAVEVPPGKVGIGTACSITLDGILLRHGILTRPRFGGLLELRAGKPTRFVEIVLYDGTSIDPLEIFITSGMTRYAEVVEYGSGRIGAGFRECPAESRGRIVELAGRLEEAGLGGVLAVGWPGQPLLEIPVGEGRVGLVVIGGLSPVALLVESGFRVHSRAIAALVDFADLFPFQELEERAADFAPRRKEG